MGVFRDDGRRPYYYRRLGVGPPSIQPQIFPVFNVGRLSSHDVDVSDAVQGPQGLHRWKSAMAWVRRVYEMGLTSPLDPAAGVTRLWWE